MNWVKKAPSRGDMVRVRIGSIYHFGVCAAEDEIIQFGLAPTVRKDIPDSDIEVISTDVDTFLAGGELEVAEFDAVEKQKHRSADGVAEYARSRLGMRGYSIIYNNCEHFANECVSGERVSSQTDAVRAMFRNMPIVDVYLAELPERDADGDVFCDLRREDIDRASNPRVKREKYFAWKLLEYALSRSFGINIEELDFTRENGGRYVTARAELSISHSKNALAVAVSRAPVGIDIEPASTEARDSVAKRFFTQREYNEYQSLPEGGKKSFFIKTWTAKEALFKASHTDNLCPSTLETMDGGYRTLEKTVGGEKYVLSVATATPERIRIFENIKL